MQEHSQKIGETAGKIYRELETSGAKSDSALAKEVAAGDTALFNQALGWLAREGKLNLEKKGSSWQVSLSEAPSSACCQ